MKISKWVLAVAALCKFIVNDANADPLDRVPVLSYACGDYLEALSILDSKGPAAVLKFMAHGSASYRSEEELAVHLASRTTKKEIADWRDFAKDVMRLQMKGWVHDRRRINLGDHLPLVIRQHGYRPVFTFQKFITTFYFDLPKMRGEEDVYYIFGHGRNPEVDYVIRGGEPKAAILVGGILTTAKEFVKILDKLGYVRGNIRMMNCWAGGTAQKHGTKVRPFIDDLVDELHGRADWIKGAEGAVLIRSEGDKFKIFQQRNKHRADGHFEGVDKIDPEDLTTEEILRVETQPSPLDRMRKVEFRAH